MIIGVLHYIRIAYWKYYMGHAIIKIMSFFVDVWNTIENRGVNSDMETQHIIHNFEPIYNEHSKILMLGTMPSPKSREVGFYYGHPRNRFWKVVSDVCGEAYGSEEHTSELQSR